MKLHTLRDRLQNTAPPIFRSSLKKGLPQGQIPIKKYRAFIIAVELIEHAFNKSYDLVITYKEGTDDEAIVGSVSVFARSDESACAACRSRREAGSVARGIIPVPSGLVDTLIAQNGLNNEDTDDDTLVEQLKSSLTASLVGPGGTVLGKAIHGGPVTTPTPFPEAIAPKVTVLSASASHPEDQERDGPYEFFDWTQHSQVFDNNWTAEA